MKTLQKINTNNLSIINSSDDSRRSGIPTIWRDMGDDFEPPELVEGQAWALVDNATPSYDSATETIDKKVYQDGDDYFYGYVVRDLTAEELEVSVPSEVTNFQIKRALNQTGDRVAVEALIAGSNDQDTIDGWQHASVFKRDNPLFLGAVAYLGWSQQKVDDLFKLAVTLD